MDHMQLLEFAAQRDSHAFTTGGSSWQEHGNRTGVVLSQFCRWNNTDVILKNENFHFNSFLCTSEAPEEK